MGLPRLVFSLVLGPPILVAGALCAAATLGAQFGRVSDDWDLLTHFAPIWLGVGLATLAAGLASMGWVRRWLIWVGLAGAALAAVLIGPEYLRDAGPTAPASAPRQLKLIQFNVWAERNRDLAGTVAWIARQNPDLVTVVESNARFRRLMAEQTGMTPSCGYCEVTIFSRSPPVTTAIPKRPDNEAAAPLARATFRDGRGEYTIIAVHPGWPTRGSRQQQEGRILAQVLRRFPQDSLILAGDFNSTPWSFSRRREDRLLGIPRRTRALFSWPAGWNSEPRIPIPIPLLPIDHVYAGNGWATVKVERGPCLGADHYPVIATLARR